MIVIIIYENRSYFEIKVKGHSMGTNEPCSRVSTALDLTKIFLTRFIIKSERKNGYTYLKIINSPLTDETVRSVIFYLYELSKLYPSHITIIER